MCCFSGPVEVADTQVFARSAGGGRQWIAYQATLSTDDPVALVLPLPVAAGAGEDAVRFESLAAAPDLFDLLASGFPPPRRPRGPFAAKRAPPPVAQRLAVHRVGAWDASYVPTVADFARLDPRFRLPDHVARGLPGHDGSGFAVFALAAGAQTVHPLAFSFPRSDPARLFFPTLHVHDGVVHPHATFDHALYAQEAPGERLALGAWDESPRPARAFVDLARCGALVDGDRHVHRLEIRGLAENRDISIGR